MYNEKRKITVEWINDKENNKKNGKAEFVPVMSNPIDTKSNKTNLYSMITDILDKELPMLKNNSLMHDLVLYTLLEKMNTVQTVENVLSYIKENHAKQVRDVYFKNGEICIKCST